MVYLISNREDEYMELNSSEFKLSDLNTFKQWVIGNNIFQLDTETLFVDDSANVNEDRKLVLIQIGDIKKEDQWLIEAKAVHEIDELKTFLQQFFEDESNSFIAHNAFFEYTVIKVAYGIRVENIHDTFLMSKILNTGFDLEDGYHSLAGCLSRFFDIEMDKGEQTTFTFELLTENQIKYASTDVLYLYDLFIKLKKLLESWDLWFLYDRVEREVIKAYADMGINEMRFDIDHWNTLSDSLINDDNSARLELNSILFEDKKLVEYLKTSNKTLGLSLIQPKDTMDLNWGSNVARKKVLTKIIPDLISLSKFTKPEIKKLHKADVLTEKENKLLKLYLDRSFTILNRYLRTYYKDWLHNEGYFLKKDDLNINWNSNLHKLYVFQFYYPNLENTNAKTLKRIHTNKLINKFKKYTKVHKSVTTYGEGFIKKYVTRRNTISPRGCRSILNTGRIAYGILLQMPSKARFRNAFLPLKKDWVFVDSDWSSVELAYAAYKSGETPFLDAIKSGKDAHSMSAARVFKEKWTEAAEPGCIHLSEGKQCECPEHKKLRQMSKFTTFGLLFGSTHVGIADRLDISRTEAKQLVEDYFKAFPNLKNYFDANAEYGKENNFIKGAPPTNRIRFFHPPVNDGESQAIGRQSMNMPIQGDCASMLKIALIKLRKYIIKHNFPAELNLPVHDEILSSCHKDVATEWLDLQEQAMQEAVDIFTEKGLIKTDSNILDRWTK